jgi:hypothetical protein
MPPTTVDLNAIAKKNRDNVKKTKDEGTLDFLAVTQFVLIGPGHNPDYVKLAKEGGAYKGTITVDKGSVLDKGTFTVTGLTANRSQFEDMIRMFSKKKIVFK